MIGHTAGFELSLELKELFLGGEQIKLQIQLVEAVRVSHREMQSLLLFIIFASLRIRSSLCFGILISKLLICVFFC